MKTPQSPAPVAGRPLTAEDVALLKGLAEAATKGDWRAHITNRRAPEIYTNAPPPNTPNPLIGSTIRKADARFQAAANPETVLALIGEVERLSRPVSTPPVEAAEGGQINRECKSCGAFAADPTAACTFCGVALSPAPASGGAVEALIADIDAEMAGRARGHADKRGELLFRCRDALAASPQPGAGDKDYRRVDLGLVATTIETMHRRIEELTGSRQSQYDGAVQLARDLYLTHPASPSPQPAEEGALREALEFYRTAWVSEPNGDPTVPGDASGWVTEPSDDLMADRGQRAAKALAAARPQHDEVAK